MDASIAANNVGNFNKCVELAVHQTVLSGLKELLDSDMRESDSPRSQLSDGVNSSLSTESIPQLPSVVEYVEYPLPSPTIEVQSSFWPLLRPNPLWDVSVFPPNCIVCKLQFKHVFRDYVVPRYILDASIVGLGTFMVTVSHLDPKYTDLGIVAELYSVEQFLELRQRLGRSLDEEENFVGLAIRVATAEERSYLPKKFEVEPPILNYSQRLVQQLQLSMDVYEVEFQFDGKVLYVYYTADGRVDYREFVAYMKAFTGVRVKMKKTNQCRKFVPRLFASVALATGNLPITF